VLFLVALTEPAQQVELGVAAAGPLDLAASRHQFQLGQVLAGEKARQVAGADDQPAFELLHLSSLFPD